jgi:cell division protein FtsI (penicillin-binding protein 3)/stage V sporulation protein D (sporulation-specific penicillin-binding protein)
LNTGAVFAGQLIPKRTFKKYLEKFGLSKKTGIDLGGEAKGDISNLKNMRDIEYATAFFGQGIAITPIELVAAMGVIANQGKLTRPYLVEKFIYPDGREETTEPKVIDQVISSETAEKLTKMMVSVVENGYGKKAGVPGYFIAGKTGTAQVPEGGGYSDKTIHSFGGFFPAFDPQFLILVKLDNPQKIRFAADSVAPVFGEIAEYILNYYEIPPSR